MHEWGIVDSLIKEVMQQAKENRLKKIDKVYLSLGEGDHLTPEALEFCFRILAKGTLLETTRLEIKKSDGEGLTLIRIEGVSCA